MTRNRRPLLETVVFVLLATSTVAAALSVILWLSGVEIESTPAGPIETMAAGDATDLADAAQKLLFAGDGDEVLLPSISFLPDEPRGLAYAALRSAGARLSEAWGEGDGPEGALRAAILAARSGLSDSQRDDVDVIEVALAGRETSSGSASEPIGENLDRGVAGMTIDLADGSVVHVSPTRMIADNRSFGLVVQRLVEDGQRPVRVALFEATQALIDLEARSVTTLVRGNVVVPASAVSAGGTRELADAMSSWLIRRLGDDGRMVYEYWPSSGEESNANNMIRQWMATNALIKLAELGAEPGLLERIAANINYNLAISFSEDGDRGLIADPDGDVKLGAVALAALAISQHPDRDRWADEESALRRTVDALWNEDGSFTTFAVPEGRNDNQNFYPGEALLLWATTLEAEPDAGLLDRFMRSFEYYRAWHREQRNPAFVPWHTMAYEKVWHLTDDDRLRDFVFEMNDWLLEMQQWEEAPADDVAGRFYNPDRPDYGPPHASSDGVYLEGLIAAYRLAVAVEDAERADAYRKAIARDIRSLMQLQFADEADMYYVTQRDRVRGGLRTSVYDNRIRVDNVQHGLMGLLDVLKAFGPSDYRIQER